MYVCIQEIRKFIDDANGEVEREKHAALVAQIHHEHIYMSAGFYEEIE